MVPNTLTTLPTIPGMSRAIPDFTGPGVDGQSGVQGHLERMLRVTWEGVNKRNIRRLLGKLRHANGDERCSMTSGFGDRYFGGVEIVDIEHALLGSSKDANYAFQRGGSSKLWQEVLNESSSGVVHESGRKPEAL